MRFRRWVSILALMALAFGLGRASVGVAQGLLPTASSFAIVGAASG